MRFQKSECRFRNCLISEVGMSIAELFDSGDRSFDFGIEFEKELKMQMI